MHRTDIHKKNIRRSVEGPSHRLSAIERWEDISTNPKLKPPADEHHKTLLLPYAFKQNSNLPGTPLPPELSVEQVVIWSRCEALLRSHRCSDSKRCQQIGQWTSPECFLWDLRHAEDGGDAVEFEFVSIMWHQATFQECTSFPSEIHSSTRRRRRLFVSPQWEQLT